MDGFMIIDPHGNSIVVPPGDKDLTELLKPANRKTAKRHSTVNELVQEVRRYMKNPEVPGI